MAENCNAIIEAWFPGEEGGNAIADVIFGDYNPAGRLPITVPKDVGQIPVYYSRRNSSFRDYVDMDGKPQFPFGFGLSYTTFEYSRLKISPKRVKPSGKIEVNFSVKNIGKIKGDEVVQLYIKDIVGSVTRPVKELKGFLRINLKPNQKKKIKFILSPEQLAFTDEEMQLIVEEGKYEVQIGASSEDIRLKGNFNISETEVILERSVFFSEVKVK